MVRPHLSSPKRGRGKTWSVAKKVKRVPRLALGFQFFRKNLNKAAPGGFRDPVPPSNTGKAMACGKPSSGCHCPFRRIVPTWTAILRKNETYPTSQILALTILFRLQSSEWTTILSQPSALQAHALMYWAVFILRMTCWAATWTVAGAHPRGNVFHYFWNRLWPAPCLFFAGLPAPPRALP